MDIHTYLKLNRGRKAQEFANRANTSLGYLRLLGYGVRRPSADMAIRIEDASYGEITAYELRPDLPWPHAPRANSIASPPRPIDAAAL